MPRTRLFKLSLPTKTRPAVDSASVLLLRARRFRASYISTVVRSEALRASLSLNPGQPFWVRKRLFQDYEVILGIKRLSTLSLSFSSSSFLLPHPISPDADPILLYDRLSFSLLYSVYVYSKEYLLRMFRPLRRPRSLARSLARRPPLPFPFLATIAFLPNPILCWLGSIHCQRQHPLPRQFEVRTTVTPRLVLNRERHRMYLINLSQARCHIAELTLSSG